MLYLKFAENHLRRCFKGLRVLRVDLLHTFMMFSNHSGKVKIRTSFEQWFHTISKRNEIFPFSIFKRPVLNPLWQVLSPFCMKCLILNEHKLLFFSRFLPTLLIIVLNILGISTMPLATRMSFATRHSFMLGSTSKNFHS